jgi:monoamine oxidase
VNGIFQKPYLSPDAIIGTTKIYKANAAKFSEGEKDQLIAFFKNIDDMGDKLDPQDPSTFKNTVELDAMTLDEYCHKFLPGRVAALIANATARGFLGVESTEISALFYIDYVRVGFKRESLTSDLKGGVQCLRARQGMFSVNYFSNS